MFNGSRCSETIDLQLETGVARYYFHVHECGTVTPDYDGCEMADIDAVREHATRAACASMCSEVAHGRLCLACSIQVVDVRGQAVMSVPFREAVVMSGLSRGF